MPGRKSNVSTVSNGPEEVVAAGAENAPTTQPKAPKEKDGLSVDDLSLPKSMVARLAKGVLPANTQIHKDALLALHKSATVFVSYIASNANDNTQASGKKTIAPGDVLNALKDSEFETFLPRLEAELKKYNEIQCDKRNNYRRKVKEEKAAAGPAGGTEGEGEGEVDGRPCSSPQVLVPPTSEGQEGASNGHMDGEERDDEGGERPTKKLKGENGTVVPSDADMDDRNDDPDDDGQDGPESAADDDDEDDDDDDDADELATDEDNSDDEMVTMEDALEAQPQHEVRGGMRDEALDDPDSD